MHDDDAMLSDDYEIMGARFRFLDPDGSVPAETLGGQIYEPTTTALLHRFCTGMTRPTVLDVGAHYGYFTVLLPLFNPEAKVLAFEPGQQQYEVLERNVAMNRSPAIPRKIALSDHEGTVEFNDRTLKPKEGFPREQVVATTWDRYAREQGLKADVVKIDVHGAEGKVLAGMREALRDDVRHLLIEVHAADLLIDYTHADILAMVRESGMTLFECEDFRVRTEPDLRRMSEADQRSFADPSRWTARHVKYERLLYATRDL